MSKNSQKISRNFTFGKRISVILFRKLFQRVERKPGFFSQFLAQLGRGTSSVGCVFRYEHNSMYFVNVGFCLLIFQSKKLFFPFLTHFEKDLQFFFHFVLIGLQN